LFFIPLKRIWACTSNPKVILNIPKISFNKSKTSGPDRHLKDPEQITDYQSFFLRSQPINPIGKTGRAKAVVNIHYPDAAGATI
jgi:hypothetical protein